MWTVWREAVQGHVCYCTFGAGAVMWMHVRQDGVERSDAEGRGSTGASWRDSCDTLVCSWGGRLLRRFAYRVLAGVGSLVETRASGEETTRGAPMERLRNAHRMLRGLGEGRRKVKGSAGCR